MNKLMNVARRFREEEDGAALVEYTILLGIITALAITSILAVGTWVNGKWSTLNATLTTSAPNT